LEFGLNALWIGWPKYPAQCSYMLEHIDKLSKRNSMLTEMNITQILLGIQRFSNSSRAGSK